MKIKKRQFDEKIVSELISEGVNPLLASLYAARGVVTKNELETSLTQIIPPEQLTNAAQMAKLLADAIAANHFADSISFVAIDMAAALIVGISVCLSDAGRIAAITISTPDFVVPNTADETDNSGDSI